jgi:excisionase family DNA binding protein
MEANIIKMGFNRKEAAKYLGVSENTLVKYLKDEIIPFKKVDGRVFITRIALDKFLGVSA